MVFKFIAAIIHATCLLSCRLFFVNFCRFYCFSLDNFVRESDGQMFDHGVMLWLIDSLKTRYRLTSVMYEYDDKINYYMTRTAPRALSLQNY